MTLFDFAIKNILRDVKAYLYYYLNCVFAVLIFFLFQILSQHPALAVIDTNSSMGLTLMAAELVSICFSLIFITYSVSQFLQGRSKQFGIITILGGSKKQLNRLLFWENFIISVAALCTGILLGLILAKVFLSFAARMIGGLDLPFYFPLSAIAITLLALGCVFLFIAILVPRMLRHSQILALLKRADQGDKPIRPLPIAIAFGISVLLTIAALILPDATGWISYLLLPCGCVALYTGTYLFLILVFNIQRRLAKSSGRYFNRTRMLDISNFYDTFRTNLKTMALTTLLYTISFLSIILMVSATRNVASQTRAEMPCAFWYTSWSEQADTLGNVDTITQTLMDQPGYRTVQETFYQKAGDANPDRQVLLSQSGYNQIAAFFQYPTVTLTGGQVLMVAGDMLEKDYSIPQAYQDALATSGYTVSLAGTQPGLLAMSGYLDSVTVVSDEAFQQLSPNLAAWDAYAFDVNNWQDLDAESQSLIDAFTPILERGEGVLQTNYHSYQLNKLSKNLILYIGSILCFAFLLAVGSFIYSRLYASMDKESAYYRRIVRIGLSQKELRHLIRRFIAKLLLIPFGLAILYLWVGVFIIDAYSAVSNIPTALVCTGIYTVLQGMVFTLIHQLYQRKMFAAVYGA
ncbi:ABC transporter permease [Eubacterium sp.]|uniref:ABC transporter permease n=1 Tax=Eubacterium sp. TaxID=142586 RepID=UPI002FC9CE5D